MKDFITAEDFIFSLDNDKLRGLTKEKMDGIVDRINKRLAEAFNEELETELEKL